jgi:RNA polymerase sigma-70 factor (ECF subfamily)
MQKVEATGGLFLVTGERQNISAVGIADRPKCQEASLVEAVRLGDHDAFTDLYQKYAPMVHGILLARVPRKEVDDLMQEVFLTAFRRIESLREAAAFGGWLAMITRNKANDYYRLHLSGQETETSDGMLMEYPSTEDASAATAAQEILAIIQTLPEAYRETLVMRLVEGLTGPEIADLSGLTPASVRVNLSRGMKMLREKLTQEKLP